MFRKRGKEFAFRRLWFCQWESWWNPWSGRLNYSWGWALFVSCFWVSGIARSSLKREKQYPLVIILLSVLLRRSIWVSWLPCGSEGKEFTYDAGDPGSIPGSGRSPGGGNATHSSILAWRIPPTEEPGGLQSMGWQRVSHSWAANTAHTPSKGEKLMGEERTRLMGTPVLRVSLMILGQRRPHLLKTRLMFRTHCGNSRGSLNLVLKKPSLKTRFLYWWTGQSPA